MNTEAEIYEAENGSALICRNDMPHCAVVLVLDTSHSMWGKGLRDLKQSLRVFQQTLIDTSFAQAELDLAAISMGENLGVLEEFTPFRESRLASLAIRPKGDTPIGAALSLALQMLAAQSEQYRQAGRRQVTPQLILLSDGKDSSDDYTAVAADIRNACAAGKLVCHAIALGDSPDCDALRRIAGTQIVFPQRGALCDAFAEVGQTISQTYEAEASETPAPAAPAPMAPAASDGVTEYLLDGSNILYWDRFGSGITLRYVLGLADYLERQGLRYRVFFDATARHILAKRDAAEAAQYEALLRGRPEHFLQVPAGTAADAVLLHLADTQPGSVIISNDLFRDHAEQYPWLHEKTQRIISGMVLQDAIFFPSISLQIPVGSPENRAEASL